jgi:hypothetical protein
MVATTPGAPKEISLKIKMPGRTFGKGISVKFEIPGRSIGKGICLKMLTPAALLPKRFL